HRMVLAGDLLESLRDRGRALAGRFGLRIEPGAQPLAVPVGEVAGLLQRDLIERPEPNHAVLAAALIPEQPIASPGRTDAEDEPAPIDMLAGALAPKVVCLEPHRTTSKLPWVPS